ncbi:MAG TPA: pyridoxal phosphate-dependent aminotransferase family protein [Phycisphaerales bacterium]|nr:pyridoxal phosphate-dependent aminotransferase family protein [Phycisphaerales bacterium]
MARLPIESLSPTSITLHGRELLAFAGCNYLGLGSHPRVVGALCSAAERLGISTTASRETTGNTLSHEALEAELAQFTGLEGAILSAEGYTANFTALQALSRDHRVALIDAHAHRSLRHAAIAAGLHVCEYEHLSVESAAWLVSRHMDQGVVVMTDSVFAADGAIAPLRGLLGLLPRKRATLLVDDCHGLCVLGPGGRGSIRASDLDDPRIVVTTTLAKGLGCYGGAVLGTRAFIDRCQEQAWVYRSSTPPPPAICEAVRAALRVLRDDETLVASLRRNIELMRQGLFLLGLQLPPEGVPIFTFAVSPEERMERVHELLMDEGVFAPLISYPGGPAERYFRVVVNACHTPEQIDRLCTLLARALDETRMGVEVRRTRVVETKPVVTV